MREDFYKLLNAQRHTNRHESTFLKCVCECVFVCVYMSLSNTLFNHRWALTSPWQISTCVWDQCCCTCGSSPWSHSLCTITHHLRPCVNEWMTDGRISPDKKHQWLIKARLSTWGRPSVPRITDPKMVHFSWSSPPDSLGRIPQHMDMCGQHHCYMYVHKVPQAVIPTY